MCSIVVLNYHIIGPRNKRNIFMGRVPNLNNTTAVKGARTHWHLFLAKAKDQK